MMIRDRTVLQQMMHIVQRMPWVDVARDKSNNPFYL